MAVGAMRDGASPFGVEDQAGNVWEWVADWYATDGYDACSGGCTDPTGPATGTERSNRGGGQFASDTHRPVVDPLRVLRAALRDGANPAGGYVDIGFRCAYGP